MATFKEVPGLDGKPVLINLDRIACINKSEDGLAVFVFADRVGRDSIIDAFQSSLTWEQVMVMTGLWFPQP